jgi:Putative beta-barrel porin-2, OmpL-like. bbp2
MKILVIPFFICFTTIVLAQTDTSKAIITLSGYAEVYYSYDPTNPSNHQKSGFVFSHNRSNEVNLNLGFIKANYQTKTVRSNMALMAGTYANANLANEPGLLKAVYEANVGLKLSKKHNLWLDAGIMPSHIGFESAIGKDCWNLTRSMLADNSPYFETGAKIGFTSKNEKWFISGLILNGWQRIQRQDGNNALALGHQLTYKPSSKITLNSSSFVGSDTPDSVRCMRYFHNFYGQFQISKKFGVIVGFDIGIQQNSKKSDNYSSWFSPVLIGKYQITSKSALAIRGELFSDEKQTYFYTGNGNGLNMTGCSVNYDYSFLENLVWRIEVKGLSSKTDFFNLNNNPSKNQLYFTTALAISF